MNDEYAVSVSANADREYYTNFNEAVKEAKKLSMKQTDPVYIDAISDEETVVWWTVTNGIVTKH